MSRFRLFGWLPSGQQRLLTSRWLQRRRRYVPSLEGLEDRTLLSQTLTVTSSSDTGLGSLRNAVNIAGGESGDTIVFDPSLSGQTITLTGGDLVIFSSLTIVGLGANNLGISGGGNTQVFRTSTFYHPSFTLSLSGLTIANGQGNHALGAALYVDSNVTVMINNCNFVDNKATSGGGGAIWNSYGQLTISNSTFSGNASGIGGAIDNDNGNLTVSNSTFSGNQALGSYGGAIASVGSLTISNSTLSGNSAGTGGAIDSAGMLSIHDTILAGNTASTGPDLDGSITIDLGNNLIGNTSGASGFVASDLLNVNPLLGPLQDNGGPTPTMALFPGSPAIDAGDETGAPLTDQRGFARIANGAADIGAFEVQIFQVYSTADSGGGSLRTALRNADKAGGSVILFAVGGIINLASPLPPITRSVQVIGSGVPLTVQRSMAAGTPGFNIFTVAARTATIPDLEVNISDLTIANGNGSNGGGIWNVATLTLSNCTLSGNSGIFGGAIQNRGTLTVIDSTLSRNSAGIGGGGGIANLYGNVTISNSTLSGNTASFGGPGGGIDNGTYPGTVTIRDTILAGNLASSGPDCNGALTSVGGNLIGNTSGLTNSSQLQPTDLQNINALLGPLQDNGGPTPTMALRPGSPAISAGDTTDAPGTDQRGLPRVVNGSIDIGAFQTQIGAATQLVVFAPSSATVGAPFDGTVVALDAYGHTASGYTGTISFSCTDSSPGVVLPPRYSFTSLDAGRHTFPGEFTLVQAGNQAVTATDTTDSSITGSVTVNVTTADYFQIMVPPVVVSGVPFSITVTAFGPYAQQDTNYTGTVMFSSTDADPGVMLPSSYPFQSTDGGTHTFVDDSMLITSGKQTITVMDTVNGITGSAIVMVYPGAPSPPGGGARETPLLGASTTSPVSRNGPTSPQILLVDRLYDSTNGHTWWFLRIRRKHEGSADAFFGETDHGLVFPIA